MAPQGWEVTAGDGPVDFMIGMRWLELWRLAARPWVALAFARMLLPAPGLAGSSVGVRRAGPVVVQRWASLDAVQEWARDRGEAHAGPWGRFAREVGGTAEWGVWHEVGPAR